MLSMRYSETKNYGFNIILKQYAKFPRFLPLPCHFEHGWTAFPNALVTDLETQKPLMLVFSKRRKQAWQSTSSVPVAIIGSPFSHYKDFKKISKKSDAKGTVVFPSHSTPELYAEYDVQEYCNILKKFPPEFQPVTICLFWLDFVSNIADIYRRAGFTVVTAGSRISNSLDFAKNFYEILSDHKYSSSNEVGSYTFNSVDIGIPFFLSGDIPIVINRFGKDRNIGKKVKLVDFKYGKIATDLFDTGPIKEISDKQSKFVMHEIGASDHLDKQEMNKLLWKFFWKDNFGIKATLPYWLITFLVWVGLNKLIVPVLNFFRSGRVCDKK